MTRSKKGIKSLRPIVGQLQARDLVKSLLRPWLDSFDKNPKNKQSSGLFNQTLNAHPTSEHGATPGADPAAPSPCSEAKRAGSGSALWRASGPERGVDSPPHGAIWPGQRARNVQTGGVEV